MKNNSKPHQYCFYIIQLIFVINFSTTYAQTAFIPQSNIPNYIKTIQFKTQSDFTGIPLVKLGKKFTFSFDDLQADEKDYYYQIQHYDYDWKPSILNKNEYVEGFDNIRIQDYENSFNTLETYSHYQLEIPNMDTYSLKVTGNYSLDIYNRLDEKIFSQYFIVYDTKTSIKTWVKRSRNLNNINEKQRIAFKINNSNHQIIQPKQTLKIAIFRNGNLNQAIQNITPQYTIGDEFTYNYDKICTFEGGNEFLFFDTKEVRNATLPIQKITTEDLYHHYLYTNTPRNGIPYTFNADINGQFLIQSLDKKEVNLESDYTIVHFSLKYHQALKGDRIHLYGNFNQFKQDSTTLMKYDKASGTYQLSRAFKQGIYNYSYVIQKEDGSIDTKSINGSFDETENEYTIIAYYKAPNDRYDSIIGIGVANSRNMTDNNVLN